MDRAHTHVTPETYNKRNQPVVRKRTLVAEAAVCTMVLLIPLSVNAGWLNSVGKLFATESAVAAPVPVTDTSAAFTPLLAAVINPDPQSVGGADLTIVDGSLRAGGPVGQNTVSATPKTRSEISVYTVREGDALSYIAQMYGVTVNTIIWANDLRGASDIQPGDNLVILPIAGVMHIVEEGETLEEIVEAYDADLEEVISYNQLGANAEVAVGAELMIPGGAIHASAPASAAAAAPAATGGSWLSHPVPGAVRTQGIHGYNGVDYGAAYGTAIRAAASGEVIIAKASGWNGGYGAYVVIKHGNGAQTLYAHLSEVYVGVGDWVTVGTNIGAMGNTGRSTGVHLHFEVRGGSNPF